MTPGRRAPVQERGAPEGRAPRVDGSEAPRGRHRGHRRAHRADRAQGLRPSAPPRRQGKTVTKARRVIVAIGRSGNHRKLGVPGENLDKVFNRLYDPKEFAGKQALVVGGGDSALETAIALGDAGAHVTLSYRKKEFARPKPENVEKIRALEKNPSADVEIEHPSSERVTTATGRLHERQGGRARAGLHPPRDGDAGRPRRATKVVSEGRGRQGDRPRNDVVFTMLGREAPLEFFRRSGIPIRGEWRAGIISGFAAFLLFCVFLYNWKAGGAVNQYFQKHGLFPYNVPGLFERAGGSLASAAKRPDTFLGTLTLSLTEPGFYYSFAYCLCVLLFGIARIRRRKTPYVTRQTITLTLVQWIPLFLLPYLLLPWLGHNGVFDHGFGKTFADNLFPAANYGQGREYWRAFGFILAWPLFIWNVFSSKPMSWWLVIAFVPDLRDHPAHHPPVGQGRLLRLDLLVRRARRDDGRHAAPEDAARPVLEPVEHGGTGDPRRRPSFCSSREPSRGPRRTRASGARPKRSSRGFCRAGRSSGSS